MFSLNGNSTFESISEYLELLLVEEKKNTKPLQYLIDNKSAVDMDSNLRILRNNAYDEKMSFCWRRFWKLGTYFGMDSYWDSSGQYWHQDFGNPTFESIREFINVKVLEYIRTLRRYVILHNPKHTLNINHNAFQVGFSYATWPMWCTWIQLEVRNHKYNILVRWTLSVLTEPEPRF